MKILILLLMPVMTISQKPTPLDSLANFSYLLVGTNIYNQRVDNSNFGNCTGFFVRKDTSLYLVTAGHCVSGCEINTNTKDFLGYQNLSALIPIKKFSWVMIKIPAKGISDTITCKLYYEDADVFVYKIQNAYQHKNVRSIENYLVSGLRDVDIIDTVYTYSYPYVQGYTLENVVMQKPVFGKLIFNSSINGLISVGKIIDSLNYATELVSGRISHGSSGAPVFFRNKEGFFFFGGVISRGSAVSFFIVKPEKIIKAIWTRRD